MADESSGADDLRKQNAELREKLVQYKSLEEDLMAQRVYEKARKQFTAMLTLGGIAAIAAGILGFKSLDEYARKLADDALKASMQEHMEKVLQAEVHTQIAGMVQDERTYVRQQIVIATQPLGASSGEPAAAMAPATSSTVDYTANMLPVRDQGQEGSSTGFAVAAALEYQIRKSLGQQVRLSPRFLYYASREREHAEMQDVGATISDAVLVAKERGVVADSVWPYVAGQYASHPPASVDGAKHYRAAKTVRLSNLAEIKSALAGGPVVAGITAYPSAFRTKSDGLVPMPGTSEQVVGGYPICVVGYDDQRKLLKFESSWGVAWGEHGYGYLSYDYVEKYLSTDNWALTM
jgi:C1A family cysteine protease